MFKGKKLGIGILAALVLMFLVGFAALSTGGTSAGEGKDGSMLHEYVLDSAESAADKVKEQKKEEKEKEELKKQKEQEKKDKEKKKEESKAKSEVTSAAKSETENKTKNKTKNKTTNKTSNETKEVKEIKTEKASGDYMSTVELNVRDNPGLSTNVKGVLQPNKKVTALEKATVDGVNWYKVTGTVDGWVSTGYLTGYKKVEQQATTQTSGGGTSNETKQASKQYAPNTIYYGGKAVHYQNVGKADVTDGDGTKSRAQQVIDSTGSAATYGGQATFNGNADTNTHFIGHNGGPNQFGGMHEHTTFIVTDGSGNAFQYDRTARYIVTANGTDVNSGVNKIDRILGSGGGNRITLQSTYSHPQKWIVEASFVKKLN